MIYISKKGKKIIEDKIDFIEKQITETYKMMGESTKIDNDLRENPEYNELQNLVSYKLPYEKQKLREILLNSSIIEDQDFYKNYNDTVIINSKVTLLYNNDKEIYNIVGYGEEDPINNIISYTCDFAVNLLGKSKNEEFRYKNSTIKILDIEKLS